MRHKTDRKPAAPRGEELPMKLRQHVSRLMKELGEDAAGVRLKMSRSALYRSAAGLTVLPGTRSLIEADLAREGAK